MPEISAWLATLGRARVFAGDVPPIAVGPLLDGLVREHRTAAGLPWVGLTLNAADINAALDWKEAQT